MKTFIFALILSVGTTVASAQDWHKGMLLHYDQHADQSAYKGTTSDTIIYDIQIDVGDRILFLEAYQRFHHPALVENAPVEWIEKGDKYILVKDTTGKELKMKLVKTSMKPAP